MCDMYIVALQESDELATNLVANTVTLQNNISAVLNHLGNG